MASLLLIAFFYLGPLTAQDSLNFTKNEIIYGRKDGMALTMIMLTPKTNPKGKAIISVVSGNWISSFTNAERFINRAKIYINSGYTVFAVIHGSQPRYSIPDEVADIKRAVRFIRHNASSYGIDAGNIGITGSSSGGHLSLMVALSDDKIDSTSRDPINRVSARIQAAAVFYPPTDFLNWGQANSDLSKLQRPLASSGVASAFDFKEWNDTLKIYQQVNTQQRLETARNFSPVYAVTPDDPPVIIIHGDADRTVPIQQSEIIIKKMKDSKVTNQFIIKKDAGHGWLTQHEEEKNFVIWFDKYLK